MKTFEQYNKSRVYENCHNEPYEVGDKIIFKLVDFVKDSECATYTESDKDYAEYKWWTILKIDEDYNSGFYIIIDNKHRWYSSKSIIYHVPKKNGMKKNIKIYLKY